MNITGTMSIGELGKIPQLAKIQDMIFTNMDDEKYDSKLSEYGIDESRLTEALVYTAERCASDNFLLRVYEDGQGCAAPDGILRNTKSVPASGESAAATAHEVKETDSGRPSSYKMIHDKSDVLLMNYAVHPGKPYIMICPGGGYNREWVLVEGYPLAMRINELGYNAFILIYRTGKTGLFPEPLDDLATAVHYIENHKEELQVETEGYAVTGASAGGHLCAMWGTKGRGYEAFGAAKPKALLLSYPAAIMSMFYDIYEKCLNEGDIAGAEGQAAILRRIGGAEFTREAISAYSLENLIDNDYPATYIVHAEDDPVVPVETDRRTAALLEQYGIRRNVRIVKKAGHSFGLGIGTDADGWLDEAVHFWQN